MKNFLFLFLLCLLGCAGNAQSPQGNATDTPSTSISEPNTTKTYAMPSGKKAVLKLPYAHTIIVKTWDKAELQLNIVVKTNVEALKQRHTVEVSDQSTALLIETGMKKVSKKDDHEMHCWNEDCDSLLQNGQGSFQFEDNNNCNCYREEYLVYLPTGTSLSIETISGDIEVHGHQGELNAKTISGFVDIDRTTNDAADLVFKCVTGEIYTDFDIALTGNSDAYDKKVRSTLNGGGADIVAETVSGDIFFRKR